MPDAKSVKKVKKSVEVEPESKPQEPTPEEVLKAKKHASKIVKKEAVAEEDSEEKPKTERVKVSKPAQEPRDPLAKRGKKYKEAVKLIDQGQDYSLDDALKLLPKIAYAKFDASVEVHIKLDIDVKQSDQLVRSTLVLPHVIGKSQRVAVIGNEAIAKEAKTAGADVVGGDNLLKTIEKGKLDFDVLIAPPEMMPALGKVAKLLGPKGLMPNPKSGTVTTDIAKAVKELKAGRLEFRTDSDGIIHQAVGKLSFPTENLKDNIKAFVKAVSQAKPASVKSGYIQKVVIAATMSPGLRLNLADLLAKETTSKQVIDSS